MKVFSVWYHFTSGSESRLRDSGLSHSRVNILCTSLIISYTDITVTIVVYTNCCIDQIQPESKLFYNKWCHDQETLVTLCVSA